MSEFKNISISNLYKFYEQCSGVSIDSRSVRANEMFFALKGPNFDGHKYIQSAIENGAKYCVVDDSKYAHYTNCILVVDVEKALQDLARYHRLNLSIPILCLTGSNGKTTTKELIASVLSEKFSVFATKGNLNNHLGVPISILSINTEYDFAVIELGANHLGEIKFLSEIAMPDFGLITNIGKAHLEGFGSLEGVRRGKTELFNYLKKVEGVIFYNEDDENIKRSIPIDLVTVPYSLNNIEVQVGFPSLKLTYKGVQIESMLSGEYNVLNIIAAMRIGDYFNVEINQIIKGIEKYTPTNNRSQIIETEMNTIIMDAYNANPSSMRVSISNLGSSSSINKVLILGHMLELGESSEAEHTSLLKFLEDYNWKCVFLIGVEFEHFKNVAHVRYFPDVALLASYLEQHKIINCNILLKGSRGVALEKLLPNL